MLRSDEYHHASDFLDDYWAKDHVYVRHPELFEWTFRRPDLWTSDDYSFAIGEDGEEVTGILGAIPFEFNFRGESSDSVWPVNWMSHPERREGI